LRIPSSLPGRLLTTTILTVSFLSFFPFLLSGRLFLGMDAAAIFYPVTWWAHQGLQNARFPLICDLFGHGTPLTAVFPFVYHFPPLSLLTALPQERAFNLIIALPYALMLAGPYPLGRGRRLARAVSCVVAWIWAFNTSISSRMDQLPLTWSSAFVPWSFHYLQRALASGKHRHLLIAALFMGSSLWVGHPQILLFQVAFLVFWALTGPSTSSWNRRLTLLIATGTLATLFASPRLLHTLECLFFDSNALGDWMDVDLYFHSWAPWNLCTLVFPRFFGTYHYDREGDYWGMYHFNETQAAFSVVGLVLFSFFLIRRHPERRWLTLAFLFSVLMAFGQYSPLYRLTTHLPIFSLFRDPARWWIPAGWCAALGAGFALQTIAHATDSRRRVGFLAATLTGVSLAFILLTRLGLSFLHSSPIQNSLRWLFELFVVGSPLHENTSDHYLVRIHEKVPSFLRATDLSSLDTLLPLLFLVLLAFLALSDRFRRHPRVFLVCLALLVFGDLRYFREPFGSALYDQDPYVPCVLAGPVQRVITLAPSNERPYDPHTLSLISQPNVNARQGIPNLFDHLGGTLPRYLEINREFGWFSWVYHGRDGSGWTRRPSLLRAFGVDHILTDRSFRIHPPFAPSRENFPFAYRLLGTRPPALWVGQALVKPWPEPLSTPETAPYDPSKMVFLDAPPDFPLEKGAGAVSLTHRDPTVLLAQTQSSSPGLAVFQKSFLPGWKATVDGQKANPIRCDGVLLGVPVPAGSHRLELRFDPTGLRLGFFLSLLVLSLTLSLYLRREDPR